MTTQRATRHSICVMVFCIAALLASCTAERSTQPGGEESSVGSDVDAAPGASPALPVADKAGPEPGAGGSDRNSDLKVDRDWGTVLIDAGHGGDDKGAVGVSGAEEKDVTLAIARELSRALASRGLRVVETRTDDTFLSLERRTSLANASGASLLVSIHANSAPSDRAHGVETYYMDLASDEAALRLAERENRSGQLANGAQSVTRTGVEDLVSELRMGATAQQSRELAETIHKGLLASGTEFYGRDSIRDRGVRTAPFWVLVDSQIPAVLVEVGYLTHETEEQRLRTRGFQHLVGDSLAESIAAFSERAARVVPSSVGGAE